MQKKKKKMQKNVGSLATIEKNGIGSESVKFWGQTGFQFLFGIKER